MPENKEVSEYLVKVLTTGDTFLLPLGDNQTAFHSMRVRLYRERTKLDKILPGAHRKIEISQTTIDGVKYLMIRPSQVQQVFKLVNGKPVNQNQEKIKDYQRILKMMHKDEAHKDIISQVIDGIEPDIKEEVLAFYNTLKEEE